MKKICLVVPYFGTLPKYFNLWLKACRRNPDIDFMLFTDDRTRYNFPPNVKVTYTSFEKIIDRIKTMYDFEIVLDTPYKLCDYKPAYGEIFSELLTKYDYWGHCDLDVIFGNIRKFITDDLLEAYDRILTRGHFSLYRNTPTINQLYRSDVDDCQNYRDVFTTSKSCCFDEWAGHCGNGVSYMYEKLGITQYDDVIYADLDFKKYQLELAQEDIEHPKRIFTFKKGVFGYLLQDDELVVNEYMYIHFQKRFLVIKNDIELDKLCYIPPNIIKRLDFDLQSIDDFNKVTSFTGVHTQTVFYHMNRRLNQIISKLLKKV